MRTIDYVTAQPDTVARSTGYEYEQLLQTFHDAERVASCQGRAILVSFKQPFVSCDPLRLFAALRRYEMTCIFWEKPSERRALVGMGEAAVIEAEGPMRLTSISKRWQNLLQHALIRCIPSPKPGYWDDHSHGPAVFGSCAFDPYGASSELWKGFPNSYFVLPHILLSCHMDETMVTLNHLVQPGEDVRLTTSKIMLQLVSLRSTVENIVLAEPIAHKSAHFEQTDPHLLSPDAWMTLVKQTVQAIEQGTYKKVVLARGSRATLASPGETFESVATLQRLRRQYPEAYIFTIERGEHAFIGATPEQLASVRHGHLETMALAGSARRGRTAAEDQHYGASLLSSRKDLEEHAFVVAMLRESLAALCSSTTVSSTTGLLKLKNVQHLVTYLAGELRADCHILDVLTALHPTPAVGGLPRQQALATIRLNEQLDRGWYSGPIGWFDGQCNGEFAVALRCALVERRSAVLFAGCGIVGDSDPQLEYTETRLKLRPMIEGLCGGDNLD